jgi:hypothetical protein
VWGAAYYFKYTSEEWTRAGGWKVKFSKPMTMPESPSYPHPDPKYQRTSPDQYNSQNFNKETTALDIKPSMPVTW